MAVFSTLPKAAGSDDEVVNDSKLLDKQCEMFSEMKQDFEEKSVQYTLVERKWRNRQFLVAVVLGILPVMAGVTQLLPKDISPWITLGISIINVIVVVVNVKLDMGERIADASMASKGYGKITYEVDMFLAQLKCGEAPKATELMVRINTTMEGIDANLTYPELPLKARKNQPLPSRSLSGMFTGLARLPSSSSLGGIFKAAKQQQVWTAAAEDAVAAGSAKASAAAAKQQQVAEDAIAAASAKASAAAASGNDAVVAGSARASATAASGNQSVSSKAAAVTPPRPPDVADMC